MRPEDSNTDLKQVVSVQTDAQIAVAFVDEDGYFLSASDAFYKMLGIGAGCLHSMSFSSVFAGCDLGKAKGSGTEFLFARDDGQQVWLHVSLAGFSIDSCESFYLCTLGDISEQKFAEFLMEPLTERETKVLELMSHKRRNAQIAQQLHFSFGTVKLDVRHIFRKLRVNNRKAAVRKAVEIGLIPPPLETISSFWTKFLEVCFRYQGSSLLRASIFALYFS